MLDEPERCRKSLVWCAVGIRRRFRFAEPHHFDGHNPAPRGGSCLAGGSVLVGIHRPILARRVRWSCEDALGSRDETDSFKGLASKLRAELWLGLVSAWCMLLGAGCGARTGLLSAAVDSARA